MSSETLLHPSQELPEHLREGLQIFNEWASARAACGQPLPPGGSFVLTKITVLADAILRMRRRLAVRLQMPIDCVKTDVEHEPGKGIVPRVDITPPPEWLDSWQAPGSTDGAPTKRIEEFAKEYIQGAMKEALEAFNREVSVRIAALGQTRPDLEPSAIEDLLEPEIPGS